VARVVVPRRKALWSFRGQGWAGTRRLENIGAMARGPAGSVKSRRLIVTKGPGGQRGVVVLYRLPSIPVFGKRGGRCKHRLGQKNPVQSLVVGGHHSPNPHRRLYSWVGR